MSRARKDPIPSYGTMTLIEVRKIPPPQTLRGIRYYALEVPRSAAPTTPKWARLALFPQTEFLGPPAFVSPLLVGSTEEEVLPSIRTVWKGHFAGNPRLAWHRFRGHRYLHLDVVYALFPKRAKRLERLLRLASEAKPGRRRSR